MNSTSAQYPGVAFADGDAVSHPLSAARVFNPMDAALQDAIDPPAALITRAADQVISTSGAIQLSFDSPADCDNDVMFSAGSPTKLTAKHAGRYQLSAGCTFDVLPSGSGSAYLVLIVNGTDTLRRQRLDLSTGHTTDLHVSLLWPMDVNDYVEAWVNHTYGSAVHVVGPNTGNPLIFLSAACQGF